MAIGRFVVQRASTSSTPAGQVGQVSNGRASSGRCSLCCIGSPPSPASRASHIPTGPATHLPFSVAQSITADSPDTADTPKKTLFLELSSLAGRAIGCNICWLASTASHLGPRRHFGVARPVLVPALPAVLPLSHPRRETRVSRRKDSKSLVERHPLIHARPAKPKKKAREDEGRQRGEKQDAAITAHPPTLQNGEVWLALRTTTGRCRQTNREVQRVGIGRQSTHPRQMQSGN